VLDNLVPVRGRGTPYVQHNYGLQIREKHSEEIIKRRQGAGERRER
jgi:hypothetical protein